MNMFNIKNRKSQAKSEYIDFDFSDPNIAYIGGGGGQPSGGTVVQSTDPAAANAGANLQYQGAQQASRLYSDSIGQAIQAINQNYNTASYNLQPAQTTGIAALDQLNQYLGLPAWNPGTGPLTMQQRAQAAASKNSIDQYITTNSTYDPKNNGYTFSGPGTQAYNAEAPGYWDPSKVADWNSQGVSAPAPTLNMLTGNSALQNAVRSQLQSDFLNDPINQQAYDNDMNAYNANKAAYDKYTAAGPLTQQQITDQVTNQPGYQAQLGQGVAAIAADASSKGYLGSGKILKSLSSFGQNTLSQYYGQTLSRLAGLVDSGNQASQAAAGLAQSNGNSLSQLYQSLGTNQANAQLAGSNAQAQGLITAGQRYNIMGQTDSGGGGLAGIGSLLSGEASVAGAFGKL